MADTAINVDGIVQHTSNLPLTYNINQPFTPTGPAAAAGVGADHDHEDDRQLRLQGVPRPPRRSGCRTAISTRWRYTLSKQDTDFAWTDAYVLAQDVGPVEQRSPASARHEQRHSAACLMSWPA
jgi:hypothetical protein